MEEIKYKVDELLLSCKSIDWDCASSKVRTELFNIIESAIKVAEDRAYEKVKEMVSSLKEYNLTLFLATNSEYCFAKGEAYTAVINGLESLKSEKQEFFCEWLSYDGESYEADCGFRFYFVDNFTVEENNFKFCPLCGKLIKVINEGNEPIIALPIPLTEEKLDKEIKKQEVSNVKIND
jgi:Zn finger protein HypA/HybF involved in hydrogenase expression